jgi:dihydrofolate synthase / folylpolyglutamate synthase
VTTSLDYLFGLEQFGIKFGLENIRALVDSLGHPERAFRSVHIAGTNGKGSVTAMVDTALRAAGFTCGRYTSPHLIDVTERFVVDGRPVTRDALAAVVDTLRDRVDTLIQTGALQAQPTFFEVTTAAAMELFRRAGVEIAVIEVGLGGRLDSTNVITPMVTAITSIALDHERYLGNTIGEIAMEKAGIIKPGIPIVIGSLPPEAESAVESVARERGAALIRALDGVVVESVPPSRGARGTPGDMSRICLRTPAHDYGELTISLHGSHQIGNAIVAVRVLELLDREGIRVPVQAVATGLGHVSWPGRLEHRRLPDGREMILDAAHNPAGAATLAAYLAETLDEKPPLVFAAMSDKDVPRMFEALLPSVSALVVTRTSSSRSAAPETLRQQAVDVDARLPVLVHPVLADALAAAWQRSPRIVVAGSIFLLADVMRDSRWS